MAHLGDLKQPKGKIMELAANGIVLGMSAAFSGPSGGLGNELYRGAKACFEQANAQGGINGRPVGINALDDGYQPGLCVANTTELMRHDNVFALFGYVGTPTVSRVLPLLQAHQDEHLYLFFPFSGAEPQREPPHGEFAFNLRPSYRAETAGLVDNLLDVGRYRIAVFYQDDDYGRSGLAGVREALRRRGEQLASEAGYRRGAAYDQNMNPQVEALKAGDPDAVICVGAYAACAAFLRDAVDGGLRVPIANLSFVGSENLLQLINSSHTDSSPYTDLLVHSQVVPSYEDTTLPAVRDYRELIERYDPRLPAELNANGYQPFEHSFASMEGFLNARLMVEVLRRLGDNPSRDGLERAVFTVQDYDLGIGERVSFSPDRRQGLLRVYYTVVSDGRFVPLADWKARFGA